MNMFKNFLRGDQYLVVPISQDLIAEICQNHCPLLIGIMPDTMLTTIRFNNQLRFNTHKVHNIRFDYHLTPEFESRQPARPQVIPKPTFGFGHVAAERSRQWFHKFSILIPSP